MSDANRVQISYVAETTFGDQETGSNLQVLRLNSESLNHDMATTVSEELRSDRQISDIARIGVSASGDIAFELSYGSHDDFLKAALMAASWSSEVKISSALTISASSTDNSINDSASGFGSFVENQWVYVSGFTTAANNGFFKVGTVTAAKLILQNGTLVTEIAGDLVTVQMGPQVTNGTTAYSYNIEKEYQDLSSILSLFKGMSVNTMSLEVPADGRITGSFGFLGSAEESLTATGGAGYTTETTTVIMTGANHVPRFMENLSDTSILSFSLSLNNNLRTRMIVGTLGVDSMGVGSVEVTGSVQIHFTTAALYNKYLNQTRTSIAIGVRDVDGNGYIIDLPSVKIVNGTRSAGGINTDVIGEFEFSAIMDSTEEVTIRVARFPIMANLSGVISATATTAAAFTIP